MKKALISEECLGRSTGHFEPWISGIAGALSDAGMSVEIIGSIKAVDMGAAHTVPWFSRSYLDAYMGVSTRILPRLLAAIWHNISVFLSHAQWLLGADRYDLVMATHVNVFHLLGWRLIWFVFGGWKIRRLVLNSLVPMWLSEYDGSGEKHWHSGSRLVGFLYRLFRSPVASGSVLLTAETENDAKDIAAVSGVPVVTIPTPRPESLIEAARAKIQERRAATAAPPVLGWLGRCSEEKGFSIFCAAVCQFLREHPTLPCFVLVQYLVGPDGCHIPESEIDALAVSDPRIRLLKKSVSGDAYGRLLGELDCLVLPYQKNKYIGRNSSAALDAVLAGIPIITTEGTWMADLLAQYGAGLASKNRDSADLARGFRLFVEDFESFSVKAWNRSDVARSRISWAQFTQIILPNR